MERENELNYDIVITGGGTAGCACAWTASSLGLKTLLVEKKSYLGGAITSQLVIPAMKTNDNNLNNTFYKKLIKLSQAKNAQITYGDGNPGWFNPLKLPQVLYDMLITAGCDVILGTNLTVKPKYNIETKYNNNVSVRNAKILSVYIDTNYSDNNKTRYCKKINAKYFVDATGNGNLSESCGGKFLPKEDFQALSLRFIMAGIDKQAFSAWLLDIDTDRSVTTAYAIDGDVHLSTACTWDSNRNWALKPIFDLAVKEKVLKDTDRAYFQVFSIAGETDKIAFNCPRIVMEKGINPYEKAEGKIAYEQGQAAIKRIAVFCKKYFKGFENSYVYKIADELGIRESRRVKGKYVLSRDDIYIAKEFDNPVAYSNYPIDVHSLKKDESTLDYVQKTYSIPLECLMVDGFENLFVIGRCLSADFYAQAAVRIQPTCFSMGEGVAKYIAGKLHSDRGGNSQQSQTG